MKRLFILFLICNISFAQQDSLVDVFDSKRNIIKLRVNELQLEKIKEETTSDTLYIQRKVGDTLMECKLIRRRIDYPLTLKTKLI